MKQWTERTEQDNQAEKEAQAWLANSHKVARKKYSEHLTIMEVKASKVPPDVARHVLQRYDTPQLKLPGRAVLMGLLLSVAIWGVVCVAVWHAAIGAWIARML